MSFRAFAWAMDTRLPAAQKMILLILGDSAGEDHVAYMPPQRLADRAGVWGQDFTIAIEALRGAGLLDLVEADPIRGQGWLLPKVDE